MRYTEEFKLRVLEEAKDHGTVVVAKRYGLPSKTVLRWNNLYHVYEKQIMRAFTDDQKREILTYANEYGMTSAMREYNIDVSTLQNWNKKFKIYQPSGRRSNAIHVTDFKHASTEKKLEVLNFAKIHGRSKAVRKFNVPHSTIHVWNKELHVYPVRRRRDFSLEQKQEILRYAIETSVAEAAAKFNLYSNQIHIWAKDLGKKI